jgi:hypothetical protein
MQHDKYFELCLTIVFFSSMSMPQKEIALKKGGLSYGLHLTKHIFKQVKESNIFNG